MLSVGLLRPSAPSNAQHHFAALLVQGCVLILMERSVKSTTQASSHLPPPSTQRTSQRKTCVPGSRPHTQVFLIYPQTTPPLKNRLAGNLFKTAADTINETE